MPEYIKYRALVIILKLTEFFSQVLVYIVPQKGFVHIIPLVVVALFVTSIGVVTSNQSENVQKQQIGKVLSEREEQEDEEDESTKKAQESAKEAAKKQTEEGKKASENSSKSSSSSSNKTKTVTKTEKSETEVETEDSKTKIKVKNSEGEFETEIEDGKEKTKFRQGNLKIEFEREGNKFVAKIKDEQGEDVELEASEEAELFDDLEDELKDDDIEIATDSTQLGFVQKGRRVRTNFPLSVNPVTGELFVTTPSGTKVVTILPAVAVENMIRAGIMSRTEEPPFPPTTPLEGTPSSSEATPEPSLEDPSIELTELGGEPVYIISGIKDQKFLGILPVEIKIKTTVSATDGQLVDVTQGFFSRIFDLLSIEAS